MPVGARFSVAVLAGERNSWMDDWTVMPVEKFAQMVYLWGSVSYFTSLTYHFVMNDKLQKYTEYGFLLLLLGGINLV